MVELGDRGAASNAEINGSMYWGYRGDKLIEKKAMGTGEDSKKTELCNLSNIKDFAVIRIKIKGDGVGKCIPSRREHLEKCEEQDIIVYSSKFYTIRAKDICMLPG